MLTLVLTFSPFPSLRLYFFPLPQKPDHFFFIIVQLCNEISAKTHRFYVKYVAPRILESPNVKSVLEVRMRKSKSDVEALIVQGLQACLAAAVSYCRRLISQQKSGCYKPRDDSVVLDTERGSDWAPLCSFVDSLLATAACTLLGANLDRFLHVSSPFLYSLCAPPLSYLLAIHSCPISRYCPSLITPRLLISSLFSPPPPPPRRQLFGVQVHTVVVAHLRKMTGGISNVGAALLARDLSELTSTIHLFHLTKLDQMFADLQALCNIFFVQPGSVRALLTEGSKLSKVDPQTVFAFAQLRADFEKNKQLIVSQLFFVPQQQQRT